MSNDFIYLINFPNTSTYLYKIGMTCNPLRRINELRREWYDLVPVIVLQVAEAGRVEKFLHQVFAEKCMKDTNEYFFLDDRQVTLCTDLMRLFSRCPHLCQGLP